MTSYTADLFLFGEISRAFTWACEESWSCEMHFSN